MLRYITVYLLLIHFYLSATHHYMDLQRAIDGKLVKATAKSLGGYQGFCIQMELRSLSKDSLVIMIEPGRRLNSVNNKNQDILITKQERISLKQFEVKAFPVKGYCCEASNHAPEYGQLYDVNKLADTNLVLLALYLNANKNESNLEQQAIWAISDNRPASRIASVHDTVPNQLKQLVCHLKGEVVPWYSLISKTILYQSGNIETVPVWLRGSLNFDCDAESYTTLRVLNEKGEEVCKVIQQWTLKGARQKYELNLPVNVLVRGRYVIELKTPEKLLASREFEI